MDLVHDLLGITNQQSGQQLHLFIPDGFGPKLGGEGAFFRRRSGLAINSSLRASESGTSGVGSFILSFSLLGLLELLCGRFFGIGIWPVETKRAASSALGLGGSGFGIATNLLMLFWKFILRLFQQDTYRLVAS